MIKKFLALLLLVVFLITGCAATSHFFGASSKAVEKQQAKIVMVDHRLNDITASKVDQVSQLSYGVNKALLANPTTNAATSTAMTLNDRIQAITGLPSLEQQKAIQSLVNDLISNNIAGQIELKNKDLEIQALQSQQVIVTKEKDKQIDAALVLSKQNAGIVDSQKQELDKYTAYWGLGGVILGLKDFIVHGIWAFVISSVLFLLLRLLATVNPIAGVIFGIFESIAASIIHMIYIAVPSSVETFVDNIKATVKQIPIPSLPPIATTPMPAARIVPQGADPNVPVTAR